MTGKTNIFKANTPDTTQSSETPAAKGNIFKSGGIDDSSYENTALGTQTNIFKDTPEKAPEDKPLKLPQGSQNTLRQHSDDSGGTDATPSTISIKSSFFSKLGLVGAGGLLGLSIGAYFAFSSEDSPQPPISTNSQVAESPTPVAPTQTLNQASVAPPTSMATYMPNIAAMLQAAHDRNIGAIEDAANSLNSVQRPPAGNRSAARTFNEQGLAALKAQDFTSAINAFRLGISEDPGNIELINNLGFALYKSGQTTLAKEQIELALLYSPKRSAAWVNLGDIFFKQGNDSNAIDAYVLAYAFSNNKDRLYRTVESMAENDPDYHSRVFYTKVLNTLRQKPL